MNRALAALLTHAVDYAGMFPPAELELVSAMDHYIRYRVGREAWILDKFVVRASRLMDLASELMARPHAEPIPLAVVGTGGATREAWETGLESDAVAMNAFTAAVGGRASILAYESKPPDNVHAQDWIRDLRGFDDTLVFLEVGWDADLVDALAALAESGDIRAKARTGGEAAAAFPSTVQLAEFIQGVVQLAVEFKLTAGLHQAFPTDDRALGVTRHGFVPVFAATAAAFACDLSVRQIATILETRDPRAFCFDEGGLTIHDWRVSTAGLVDTRNLFVSFGSCSVDEPLDTLKEAGLQID